MSTFEAVVFDMDGVIFDSERMYMRCWTELAEKYGLKDMETPYYASVGTTYARTREIMLAAYGKEFPYEKYAAEAMTVYHARYDGGRLPLKPGVEALLRYLKQTGKKVALASSTERRIVEAELIWAGLRPYFDAVICGDMVLHSKPAPDIFLTACQMLGTAPGRAYAIEDSYNGIRAAAAGGLRPIMVPDLLPATDEMRTLAETVLPDLNAVRTYFAEQGRDGEA